MATRVIYSDAAHGRNTATSGTYTTARAMTSPTAAESLASIGQTSTFNCREGYIAFDTTGTSGASAVTLAMSAAFDNSDTDFTTEVRINDWGATVTSADAVAGASLSGLTLVCSLTSAGIALSTYTAFADVAFLANVNGSGFTRLILASDRQRLSNQPTGLENISWDPPTGTLPPKLTIVDASTQSSQTINGGTTTFTPTVTGIHDLDLWGAGGRPVLAAAQERSAGGAAYSFAQYSVSSLSNVTVQVGNTQSTASTAGQDTWFGSSSAPDPLANGGTSSTRGLASIGRGIVKFDGGDGVAAQGGGGSRGGSGGGSSAGTAAAGVIGVAGSGSSGGAGGTAPSGGGNGGTGGNASTVGGSGSVPGGGAGGGGNGADAGNGAAGKMIVYWYATAAVIGPGGGLHHTGEGWGDPGVSRVPQTLHPIEQGIGT